jgi:hypothetical protein
MHIIADMQKLVILQHGIPNQVHDTKQNKKEPEECDRENLPKVSEAAPSQTMGQFAKAEFRLPHDNCLPITIDEASDNSPNY